MDKLYINKKRQDAFTLIEIMVATVVMVILTGLVIQITSEVLKVWNRSSGKLTANAEARIAMDFLTQDLETAVFRNNNMTWLESEQVPLDDPFGSGSSFKTTELKLFSPAQDRPSGAGDICGISYLLRYSDPITGAKSGDERTFILYRNVINPEATFKDLMGKDNQESLNNTLWSEDSTIDSGRNFLVSNIVDFRVDFYVEDDGITSTETLVSTYSDKTVYGGENATVGPQSTSADALKEDLAYAEITLRVISDQALQVIQNDARAQTGFETDQDYIAANSEVYTRRISFLARPL